jgi:alcohol dehydrogenase (NADP+)
MPALGFGTLILDATETRNSTRAALEAGFRHFDCAERYRNEEQVGLAISEAVRAGSVSRKDLFITTKLWNTTIVPSGSGSHSKQAAPDSNWTTSIST